MIKLIVARHAEQKKSPSNDPGLSAIGYGQADNLGSQIKDIVGDKPYKILSSPLLRARDTALLIQKHLDPTRYLSDKIVYNSALSELTLGAPLTHKATALIEEYVTQNIVLIIVIHEPYSREIPAYFGYDCDFLEKGGAYVIDVTDPEKRIEHLTT